MRVGRTHELGMLLILTGLVGTTEACSTTRPDSAPDALASDAGGDGETDDSLVDVTNYGDLLESGARIRFVLGRAAGESDLAWSVWDSRFDVDCSLRMAEDGVIRCLPWPPARASEIVYSDSACTQPLLPTHNLNCGNMITVPLSYAIPPQRPTCTPDMLSTAEPTPAAVYQLGDPVPAKTSRFTLVPSPTLGGSDTCVAGGSVGDLPKFYELGDRIPPSEFVAFTLELAD